MRLLKIEKTDDVVFIKIKPHALWFNLPYNNRLRRILKTFLPITWASINIFINPKNYRLYINRNNRKTITFEINRIFKTN